MGVESASWRADAHDMTRLTGALALSSLVLLGGAANAHAADVSFTTPGCGGSGGVSANEFTVPTGVTSVDLLVSGSSGKGARGGAGASLTRQAVPVTAGETLYLCVGVGGGDGGAAVGSGQMDGNDGGGLSAIGRTTTPRTAPLVLAGGGGGASGTPNQYQAAGGAAGLSGAAGHGGVPDANTGGGRGATTSAAGNGGTSPAVTNGSKGTALFGGDGGNASSGGGGGGGGGGAGWFGGGGGAGGATLDGAGGGGGSSHCPVGSCTYQANLAAHPSAQVVISYVVPTTTTVTLSPSVASHGGAVSASATVAPTPAGGTVAFTLDGVAIAGCGALAPGTPCAFTAPATSGTPVVRAEYSGTTGFAASAGERTLTVEAAGDGSGSQATGPEAEPAAVDNPVPAKVTSATVTAKANAVALPLACPSASGCRVSGTLAVARGESKALAGAQAGGLLARFRAVDIGAAGSRAVRVKVTDRFLRVLKRHKRTKVKATLRLVTTTRAGERLETTHGITLKFRAA